MLKCSERMVPLNRVKLTMSARCTAPLGKFPQENLNFVHFGYRQNGLIISKYTPEDMLGEIEQAPLAVQLLYSLLLKEL